MIIHRVEVQFSFECTFSSSPSTSSTRVSFSTLMWSVKWKTKTNNRTDRPCVVCNLLQHLFRYYMPITMMQVHSSKISYTHIIKRLCRPKTFFFSRPFLDCGLVNVPDHGSPHTNTHTLTRTRLPRSEKHWSATPVCGLCRAARLSSDNRRLRQPSHIALD